MILLRNKPLKTLIVVPSALNTIFFASLIGEYGRDSESVFSDPEADSEDRQAFEE
jgi:hypothetical protein